MTSKLFFAVICMALLGCTRKLTDMSAETVQLPFKIDSLTIVDKREQKLPMGWSVPLSKIKATEWVGHPELTAEYRTDIEQIIRRSEKLDGVPVKMEFRLIEGVCKLNKDWKSENEYAKVFGELYVYIPSRDLVYTSYAEMYYDAPAVHGMEKTTLKLYKQALKNVTHLTLKEIKDRIKQ